MTRTAYKCTRVLPPREGPFLLFVASITSEMGPPMSALVHSRTSDAYFLGSLWRLSEGGNLSRRRTSTHFRGRRPQLREEISCDASCSSARATALFLVDLVRLAAAALRLGLGGGLKTGREWIVKGC